jgi:hypothetical protein
MALAPKTPSVIFAVEAQDLSRTGGYNSTEYGILKTAEEHMAQSRTVVFLASCSYTMKPLIQVHRKHGIPFHNPYRRSNGFWNPIRPVPFTARSRSPFPTKSAYTLDSGNREGGNVERGYP